MGGSTVRVNEKTIKNLNEIVKKTGQSKQEILDRAVEEYRRKHFIMEANKAYTFLKNNPEKWQEEIKEREEWEITLEDGLRDE